MPTKEAGELSKAVHFNSPSPILARFSSATGFPNISDTDGNANPRGIAIRFVLGDEGHRHTDIIAHSTAFFPMSTGEGFLQMLQAMGDGTIGGFLKDNPSAMAFVQDPKPSPTSFASERYFGVNAFKFISEGGQETFVRYRIVPEEFSILSEAELATKSESYLYDELSERLALGNIAFELVAQIAEVQDVTDDATKHWPESRKLVELGTIKLDAVVEPEASREQEQSLIFDPIPRIAGVEASADPLLDMRAAIYLISGRGRRVAEAAA